MTTPDEAAFDALDKLSDQEILKALNSVLAKRQRPPTEQELAEQQARELDDEYSLYFPGGTR
ncbi:MAG: hypothetical protein ACR2KL_10975 [Nocardioidaceae bacterium]